MSEADLADLVTAAHHQMKAPLILIWDNLTVHLSARMRAFPQAHRDWLTVAQLPAYAPDLNPVGNLAACSNPDRLAAIMKNRLKRIQYRPALIDGFLAQAGPQPRTHTAVDPDPDLSTSVNGIDPSAQVAGHPAAVQALLPGASSTGSAWAKAKATNLSGRPWRVA